VQLGNKRDKIESKSQNVKYEDICLKKLIDHYVGCDSNTIRKLLLVMWNNKSKDGRENVINDDMHKTKALESSVTLKHWYRTLALKGGYKYFCGI